MGRYPEIDLNRIVPSPIEQRASLVELSGLAQPLEPQDSAILEKLPDLLGARALRQIVASTAEAALQGRRIAFMAGGHVIKTGCGPCLNQLIARGVPCVIALNGAAAIHDFELATLGRTSEDVEVGLESGSFGMAEETTRVMNGLTTAAAAGGEGLGEVLGRYLAEHASHADRSVLATAWRHEVPVTVHVALGTDILHQHPTADGAAIGATSLRDFRILVAALEGLAGGVVLNFGSAVILPEVFLKALSVLLNLGDKISGLTTGDFDFIRHYRPTRNVVQRPIAGGRGRGYAITGHHEILIPLFTAGVLNAMGPARSDARGQDPGIDDA